MATDELQTTPNNEESGIGKEIENISAVELSHKEIDVRDIKDCVMKVAEDCKRGKNKSKKLIEGIDP